MQEPPRSGTSVAGVIAPLGYHSILVRTIGFLHKGPLREGIWASSRHGGSYKKLAPGSGRPHERANAAAGLSVQRRPVWDALHWQQRNAATWIPEMEFQRCQSLITVVWRMRMS